MNLTTRLAASALSFAHLSSVGRGKQAKADDKDKDYRDKDDGEGDDKRAESDDENDTGDQDAKADDPSAGEDDDEENRKQKSPDGKKSKRAKAEEDDDDDRKKTDEDDSEEMHGSSAIARARLREQARCAAIMGCRAAGRNVPLAARLALTTRMTREEAIGVLEDSPAASAVDTSASRAARNPRLGAGGDKSVDAVAAVAASWDRAFEKVGAVRRK